MSVPVNRMGSPRPVRVSSCPSAYAATRIVLDVLGEARISTNAPLGYVPVMLTSRSGSGYGSGRSRIPLTRLKIAVLAPMPSASVRTATAEKPG